MHKIELKTKNPNGISTGANTEIYIDGQRIKGVKSFKYEVDCKGVGVVTMQYYGNVNINCNLHEIIADEIILGEGDPPVQEFGNLQPTIYVKGEDNVSK